MLSDEERDRLARVHRELAEQDPSFVASFEMRAHMLAQRRSSTTEVGDRVLACLALWWLVLILALFAQQWYGSGVAAAACLCGWVAISMMCLPGRHGGRRAPT